MIYRGCLLDSMQQIRYCTNRGLLLSYYRNGAVPLWINRRVIVMKSVWNSNFRGKTPGKLIAVLSLMVIIVINGVGISYAAQAGSAKDKSNKPALIDDRWAMLHEQVFNKRPILETSEVISLEAPGRAFDSARVSVTLRSLAAQTEQTYIKKLYLIVDKNPVPVAATFTFEPNKGWQTIDTEIRINEYTHMRVVAEMNTGELHMDSSFVKAQGGCSAPPSSYERSNQSKLGGFEASITNLLDPKVPALARIRINHPNASGMQFDQMSRTYIPAHYIHTMGAEFNQQPLFHLETNFSLSQDPILGFNFEPSEDGELKLFAIDSKQNRFEQKWQITAKN